MPSIMISESLLPLTVPVGPGPAATGTRDALVTSHGHDSEAESRVSQARILELARQVAASLSLTECHRIMMTESLIIES